jgi:hypothetical protein
MGVNYRRIKDKEKIKKLCTEKIEAYIANFNKWVPIPSHMRYKLCLCSEDQAKLSLILDYISEFVESGGDEYKADI